MSGEKGTFKETFDKLIKDGFIRARVDGEIVYLEELEPLNRNQKHNIDVVVDRIIKSDNRSRFYDSIETAVNLAEGMVDVLAGEEEFLLSANYACKICGFTVPKLEPKLFSFNAPLGACPHCKGLGITQSVDMELLIPDPSLTLRQGGIRYLKNIVDTENLEWQKMHALIRKYDIPMDTPVRDIPKEKLDRILYGSLEPVSYTLYSRSGSVTEKTT